MCRYIARPALANECRSATRRHVVLKLLTPWGDGSMHLAMSALEFK